MKVYNYLIVLFCIVCGTACRSTIYYWGSYEDNIYQAYTDPSEMTAQRQIEKMEADIEVARSKNKSLPPGFHAHLGYQYFLVGKVDLARSEFILEKKKYPESKVLMNRFIKMIEGDK